MTEQNASFPDEKPPLFKNWRSLYWLVIGALISQIILFYGITVYFE